MSLIEREAVICTTCWQVIAIDGENNLDRIGSICSHLSMGISVVPAEQLRGAVAEVERLREELTELRHENEALEESLSIARQERDAYRRAGGQYEAPAASDEQHLTGLCGRLLVGQGDDIYDPLCVLPKDHDGRCKPETQDGGER